MQQSPALRFLPESIVLHSSDVIGVDGSKFAYFALSIAWRAAAHVWVLPDGNKSIQRDLGSFAEPIRLHLLGDAPFPHDVAVVVTVCVDDESRTAWFVPALNDDYGCLTYPFLALGVIFRVWLGQNIPSRIRDLCCCSSRRDRSY
jgi:hypothetical protein